MDKKVINVVSSINPGIWENQVSLANEFKTDIVFTQSPIRADFTVVYGITDTIKILTPRSLTGFVMTEPPEILKYSDEFLSQFGVIAGPDFRYLGNVQNRVISAPCIPYHIGIDYSSDYPVRQSLMDLYKNPAPTNPKISVITSGKRITKYQRQRIKFIKALKIRFPDQVELFGRDSVPVLDKAEILCKFKYHLALENSSHPFYWTEKLADSLFLRNCVFYSGDPQVLNDFANSKIIPIDIFDITASLHIIEQTLLLDSENVDFEVLDRTRDLLVNEHSIQNLVTKIVEASTYISSEPAAWELESMKNEESVLRKILKVIRREFLP